MEKSVILVGLEESEHSFYALQWTLQHFFSPAENSPFKLVIVHAKPPPSPSSASPYFTQINDAICEVVDGDPRNVVYEAVEKHHASLLVVGSHGCGAMKRAVLGSVSDNCTRHAHCSVMIVKRPKIKH